ncbi:MAG: thioredoxin family protein [Kiritimatiellae bacterium]|nr:thioredoxin family protein [Kiritimatiellia bacterium]
MMRPTMAVCAIAIVAALFAPTASAQFYCTPDFCAIPTEGLAADGAVPVSAVAHGYMDAAEFAGFLRANALGDGGAGDAASGSGRDSFAWRLAIAFLAGLLLNLSPCVLPMLPVQLAVLGIGANGGGRRRGALRGCVYGGAMALTYGAAGFAIARSGAIFGSIQSTRPFNAAMSILFCFLGLAMAGAFSIDFTSRRTAMRGNLPLPALALAGAAAAILAGACVAPAVLGTMLYAAGLHASGSSAALALPLALGLGLALPWPLVGAGLSTLPRPGRWMAAVKWVFALAAFALAARYALLAMPRRGTADGAVDYHDFNPAFERALASGRPIVIDFFASWCASCGTMEKTTFRDPDVAALLGKCEFLRVQVEDPMEGEALSLLARFGIRGFPAIVAIRPPLGGGTGN